MREGDRFESYILREKIAEGGMAEIFRAERVGAMNISRAVCVKCIRSSLCTDADFVRMFIDEARISSTLRHSNIVSVEHFGSHDGALFSVMEWVHGTDASRLLKHAISQGRALPVDVALFITGEVLKALEYAHGKRDGGAWLQIVHRDVTPHNVMVSYSGEVKLADFGIARATSRLHATQGDMIKGKVAYMAPEQATGGALDHRTDLFAVGIVAFELLTGERPFKGATQIDGVNEMLRGQRARVRALRPEVTPEAEALVDRLLAMRPDDRFADAGAALDALQRLPSAVTGQRTLQRLLRELYPDVQHSTVIPRFASGATEPAFEATARDVPVMTGPTAPVALAPTGTVSMPPAEPTRTASASAPVVIEAPKSAGRPRWPLALLGASALTLMAAVALMVIRARDPRPQVAPQPAVTRAEDASAVAVDAGADGATIADVVDEGDVEQGYGTLAVVANPWGTITVDGTSREDRGIFRLRPGRYRITVRQRGRHCSASQTATIMADETERREVRLRCSEGQ